VSSTKTAAADRLNLYSWFPFKVGRCGEAQDVILLDEWLFETNGRYSENADLYPEKVSNDLMGCPIKVATVGINPYVIMTENYIHNDGSALYNLTGFSVEILKLVCEKMNLTAVFLPSLLNIEFDSFVKAATELGEGISDVLTGPVPLIPLSASSSFDVTIPYSHVSFKMLVPCPKAIPGTEKFLTTFSMSVWLAIGLVLLLTAAVFWCVGNGPYRSVGTETHTYRSLSNCFQNAWSVFVAVSVPRQPTASSLRVFFFLYVCFCFAISTVFQAFFVSYLVEPKFEEKLETLDDLLKSEVVYGYHPVLNFILSTMSYPALVKFVEHKKLQEDFSDVQKCIERMITKRDIASLVAPIFATYVAREMGTVDVDKLICSLNEDIISGGLIVIFKKGNPLLDRFNILMRRYLEAGLQDRLWTELQHRASLKGGDRFREAAGDKFFAFSVSHLKPAFMVLLVGTVFSSVVFIGELIVNCLCKRREKKYSRVTRLRLLYVVGSNRFRPDIQTPRQMGNAVRNI
jgi:ABC-type amino acid transport substrate-binding protein